MAEEENLFAAENKAKSNFKAWKNVGEQITGVYVQKKIIPNQLKPGTSQTIYTIIQDDGTPILVAGRGQQDPSVLPFMENYKFGQYIGIRYEGDKPATKPGMSPTKLIAGYSKGTMKPEVLKAFLGEDVFEDEAANTLPNM